MRADKSAPLTGGACAVGRVVVRWRSESLAGIAASQPDLAGSVQAGHVKVLGSGRRLQSEIARAGGTVERAREVPIIPDIPRH